MASPITPTQVQVKGTNLTLQSRETSDLPRATMTKRYQHEAMLKPTAYETKRNTMRALTQSSYDVEAPDNSMDFPLGFSNSIVDR